MEFLTLLGLIHVLVVMAFIFWPKREAPDLDWNSCVMRRKEEERRRREFREKAVEMDDWSIFEEEESNPGFYFHPSNPLYTTYAESTIFTANE